MPVFDYVCVTCGNRFEKLHKSATACQPECPACGSGEVERKLSTFSSAGSSCPPASSGAG
ncbi:MAG TPA: zinc ribbon domain-containing protein [Geobacter sp.]|nr:zinc ribbon domain-containing protein [Geobacter sp.]